MTDVPPICKELWLSCTTWESFIEGEKLVLVKARVAVAVSEATIVILEVIRSEFSAKA